MQCYRYYTQVKHGQHTFVYAYMYTPRLWRSKSEEFFNFLKCTLIHNTYYYVYHVLLRISACV